MNQKKIAKLVKAFPTIYSRDRRIQNSPFYLFLFECEDGWYDLLWSLSKKLKKLDFTGHVLQVKQKFGGLRYYVDSATRDQWNAIEKAEKDSYHICEVCGKKGKLRSYGWLMTLCFKHYLGVLWKQRRKRMLYYLVVKPIKLKIDNLKKESMSITLP